MKLKILLTAMTFMLGTCWLHATLSAQSTNWLWAKSAGNAGYDYAMSVSSDSHGNSYLTGYFSGSITFEPGHVIVSAGSSDFYLAKYNAAGDLLWVKSFGGSDGDFSTGVAVDNEEHVFVSGYFKSASMLIGSTTLTNAGGNTFDLFLAKFDSAGNAAWAKSSGGTGDDRAYSIATDASGNSFLTGYFASASVTFGTTNLVNTGGLDAFVAKYTPDGAVLWARSAVGPGFDYAFSVAVDKQGNCYIAGDFNGNTIAFNAILLNKVANVDIWLVKMSPAGDVLWANRAGVNSDNVAFSVVADTLQNCFIAGSFKGSTLVFGSTTLTNHGHSDIFIAKYNAAGAPVWAQSAGGALEDVAKAVSIDNKGYCYLTGFFKSNDISFPGNNLTNSVNTGTADLFITEYDPSGNIVICKSVGGSGDDVANSVTADPDRNFLLAGYFSSPSLTFGSTTLTCNGTTDLFIVKSDNVSPTAVELVFGQEQVSLYPNPASDFIRIDCPAKATIGIFDAQGRCLRKISNGMNNNLIDVSGLQAGIYLVIITTDTENISRKLIKR